MGFMMIKSFVAKFILKAIVPFEKKEEAALDIQRADLFQFMSYRSNMLINRLPAGVKVEGIPDVISSVIAAEMREGKELKLFVKSESEEASVVWEYLKMKPVIGQDGRLMNYLTSRTPASKVALKLIAPLYRKLEMTEFEGRAGASRALLNTFLNESGGDLHQFSEIMEKIQHS